jgi:ketosteroid isomerase-like protein
MATDIIHRFADTVNQIEQTGDVEPLIELFSDNSTLLSPEREIVASGRDAIRKFWSLYLHSFQTVRSTFTRIRSSGELGILEWESEGTLQNGAPFHYCGVSLLDVNDDRVQRFATYYDTAALVRSE